MAYRILIADDENKIIELIRKLGHWDELGIEIAAICNNGEEALNRIRELKPDIVLTDVKMPVCGGIQLIEKTIEAGISAHFIVLSGYRHFEYARSAIQLGVVDYLLKPLDEVQLNRTLEKTCRMIDAGRQRDLGSKQLEDYKKQDQRQARMRFLEVLAKGGLAETELPKSNEECNACYKTDFEFELYRCVYLTTNLDSLLGDGESLFSEKIQESLDELFALNYRYLAFTQRKGILLIINYGREKRGDVKQAISALYYSLKNLTEIYGNFLLNIGVSLEKDRVNKLGQAFEEANVAEWGRLILMGDKVLEYDVLKSLPRFEPADMLSAEQEAALSGYIKFFQTEAAGRSFAGLSKNAAQYNDFYPGDMRRFMDYLEALLFSVHASDLSGEELMAVRSELSFRYKKARNFQEVIKEFYLYLEEWLNIKLRLIQGGKNKPVDAAKKYIEAHYPEPLSLEIVADQIHLSPSYFSKLFKLETGKGFSEYLAGRRIEKSKELLLASDDSIRRIASAVGCQDDKYFSKLFKKQVGIKPSEYKRLYTGRAK
ncbi:MAG: AraC family transcriptional regulator [Oscillospiraceae bacterium]|jgi:two-component system response regulator YesN|nr:AraC family transcriptional regulator [Oscillospiraceae bacterium]